MFPRCNELPSRKEQQAQRLCHVAAAAWLWPGTLCAAPKSRETPGGPSVLNLMGSHTGCPMNRKLSFAPWLTRLVTGVPLSGLPSCALTCCDPWPPPPPFSRLLELSQHSRPLGLPHTCLPTGAVPRAPGTSQRLRPGCGLPGTRV